jgi:putative FmdB family regulatory protein
MRARHRLEPDELSLEGGDGPGHYASSMPIYEYACMECEGHFEELVRNAEQAVACPECGAANVLRQLSAFAVTGGGGCCGGGCGCG